jgi:hypothetical protein
MCGTCGAELRGNFLKAVQTRRTACSGCLYSGSMQCGMSFMFV